MKKTNEANPPDNVISASTKKQKKPFFTLTRKNQKGQIAIFVALIFQVVFIFFALLINVGLLVHHKINLQQSTDLAAYYGAMKQAEMLNVISHINFQVRQAWKLLAWRYRIAGSFAMYPPPGNTIISFPITGISPSTGVQINPGGNSCGFNEAPALCISHAGLKDWPGNGTENFCKTTCEQINGANGNVIDKIQSIGTTSVTGASTARAIGTAIQKTNDNITSVCGRTTELGESVLSTFLSAYNQDKEKKLNTIKALFKNISNVRGKFIDLNGDLVEKGAKKTFENNLTEANKNSEGIKFDVINGASSDFTACADCNDQNRLYSEILFSYLAFFRLECINSNENNRDRITFKYTEPSANYAANYSIGVEKNPWYQVYYGVRAQSDPKIPFLPMSKIKLSAISFAKPFGGSIGPWSYKKWGSSENQSNGNGFVDAASPVRVASTASGQAQAANYTINFSNYVGDNRGLSDPNYIGKYHQDLLGGAGAQFPSGRDAVSMTGWGGSDALSRDAKVKNLELSAIAPNQFDLTYYSIEPDFENNYLKKLTNTTTNFKTKLETNTGVSSLDFAADYGGGIRSQLASAGINRPYVPEKFESLLTGWTFVNLTNREGYLKFPDAGSLTTMPFGKCNDPEDAFNQPSPTQKPPTPGNCVNGGRTGYSVKIVSQDLLNGLQGDIGGPNTGGQPIRNPIPDQFFNF